MDYKTDVVIVGAGIVGSSIARQLARYDLDIMVVEKNEDIGGTASRQNQGVICATSVFSMFMYEDAFMMDDMMTNLFTISNALIYPQWLNDLEVAYRETGAICVAKNEEEMALMERARKKGWERGDYRTRKVTKKQMYDLVPMLAPGYIGGYYCPDEKAVDVFDLIIAINQNAMENGVRVLTGTKAEAVDIDKDTNTVKGLKTDKGYIEAKYVINCCAIYADDLAKTTGYCDYRCYPRYGQSPIMDKNLPYAPIPMVRPCPGRIATGVAITPTFSGNLGVGPSADNGEDKEFVSTTADVLNGVFEKAKKLIPEIDIKDSITQFVGARPCKDPANWVLEVSKNVKGYCEAVGITQGITAAPAIACYMANLLENDGLKLEPRDDYDPKRRKHKKFVDMTEEERAAAIAEDPRYGNVICRCETITEAEIVRVIHTPPYARSLDAVKRRLRAGMGRCQGGFCSPRIVEILARELNVPVEKITKNEPGSEIVVGKCRK